MLLPTRHALAQAALASSIALVAAAACTGKSVTEPKIAVTASGHDPVGANGRCEACHDEIAAEWRVSLHRGSHADPVYQRAFAREPLPFCTECHAPEADPRDNGPSARHALGVGCVTCHAMGSGHPSAGASAGAGKSASACARCHEFSFPGSGEAMQLTVREHHASARAALPCASCHMPKVTAPGAQRGHASHRFDASRDPAMIRSAARITVTRRGPKVRFTFTPDRAGHAFPTGDLFRRLRLVVATKAPKEPDVPVHVEAFLGRKTKRPDPLGSGTVNDADDRPFIDGRPSMAELLVGDAPGPLVWRVVYERVEHPRSLDEADAVVEGAIDVAGGTLD